MGGTPNPDTIVSAQSINLHIDLGGEVFIPLKKNKSKRQKQRDRDQEKYRIKPSEAVRIAQRAFPGSKALGVRALPGRPIYVVTLRGKGQVQRVRVNAITGAITGGN
jgi:uncharacterized membrane protein YkoI